MAKIVSDDNKGSQNVDVNQENGKYASSSSPAGKSMNANSKLQNEVEGDTLELKRLVLFYESEEPPAMNPKLNFERKYKTKNGKSIRIAKNDGAKANCETDCAIATPGPEFPILSNTITNRICVSNLISNSVVDKIHDEMDRIEKVSRSVAAPKLNMEIQVVKEILHSGGVKTSILSGRPRHVKPYNPSTSKTFEERIQMENELKRQAKGSRREERKKVRLNSKAVDPLSPGILFFSEHNV